MDSQRSPEIKRPENPAFYMTSHPVLLFVQTEFLLQIVDVGTTLLEFFIAHDAHLQIHVGFDTVNDQLLQRIFIRAIATSRFSPKQISLPIIES